MSGSAAVGNYTPVRASRLPESRMVAEIADLAVIPGAGLAPQELPYVEGFVDDGNWAGSSRLAAMSAIDPAESPVFASRSRHPAEITLLVNGRERAFHGFSMDSDREKAKSWI